MEWGGTRVYNGGFQENALEHIVARHTVGGARSAGNSLFSPGTTVGDIKAMVGEAANAGTPSGGLYDFGRVIGTSGGKDATLLRIYYNPDGSIASRGLQPRKGCGVYDFRAFIEEERGGDYVLGRLLTWFRARGRRTNFLRAPSSINCAPIEFGDP